MLFRNLENMVDDLVSREAIARRIENASVSVANTICLSLALQHEDSSVATFASRAVCALEDNVSQRGLACSTSP